MTTLLDTASDAPATHVFVVGIGAYQRLLGGRDVMDEPMGLGQLASPGPSARAFVSHVMSDEFTPVNPLGSVEVVVSEADPTELPDASGNDVDVHGATFANLQTAFNLFFGRADRNEGNVALIFHSGHGIEHAGDMVLLANDFGVNADDEWSGSYNFTQAYNAMKNCKASGQYFLIDACRESTPEIRALEHTFHSPWLRQPRPSPILPRDARVVYSTSPGARAFALKGKPTQFTETVIEMTKGLGAERIGGRWLVTTHSLARAVRQHALRNRSEDAPPQLSTDAGESTTPEPRPLIQAAATPEVPAHIEPEAPIQAGRTTLVFSGLGGAQYEHPPSAGSWDFALAAGTYQLTARIDAESVTVSDQEFVLPPYYEWPSSA